jgi:hypothetical protein
MAKKTKGNRKVGRSKRNGQAARYKNEHRREQNKLVKLKRHVKRYGVTGIDVVKAVTMCEDMLGRKRSIAA